MKSITKILSLCILSASFITSCADKKEDEKPVTVDPNNFQGVFSSGEVILDATKTYKLTGKVQINAGATLTIPAGTKIEGTAGTSSYIAIAQGGKINVNGTATNPVVMTSGLATKKAGDWGGLVICGNAPINRVTGGASTAQSEVADLKYGGTDAKDNSGALKYLRIEYSGAAFNSEKEFNGISFFGVGSGTVVENVEVYNGADDGFEFFGGTVNTSNLISIGNEDDQFDWTEGWNGTNKNWFGKTDFGRGNRGIEADNFELGFTNTPISMPKVDNVTLIGPGSSADSKVYTENQGMKLRRGTKGYITNVILSGWATGIDVESNESIDAVKAGELKVTTITFKDVTTKSKGKNSKSEVADVSSIFTEGNTQGAGNDTNKPSWANGWSVGL